MPLKQKLDPSLIDPWSKACTQAGRSELKDNFYTSVIDCWASDCPEREHRFYSLAINRELPNGGQRVSQAPFKHKLDALLFDCWERKSQVPFRAAKVLAEKHGLSGEFKSIVDI